MIFICKFVLASEQILLWMLQSFMCVFPIRKAMYFTLIKSTFFPFNKKPKRNFYWNIKAYMFIVRSIYHQHKYYRCCNLSILCLYVPYESENKNLLFLYASLNWLYFISLQLGCLVHVTKLNIWMYLILIFIFKI